jgi:predicted small secreted protein
MRKIIMLSVLAACMATAACNTVAGAGKDVSSVGHATTDTAHDAAGH